MSVILYTPQIHTRTQIAVIPYAVYVALAEEIEDYRLGLRAQAALDEYNQDPSLGRSWEEGKAEWHAKE
jgi:hypothetical protein